MTTDTSPAPASRTGTAREWALRLVFVAAACALAVLFATQRDRWIGNGVRQTTDDAYGQGEVTPLSARVDGYVRHVAVGDYQSVKKGDLLLQIDDEDYKAHVAQAEAAVAQSTATIENIKARKAMQKAQAD